MIKCYSNSHQFSKLRALHIEGGQENEQLALKVRVRGVMLHATMNTLKEGN